MRKELMTVGRGIVGLAAAVLIGLSCAPAFAASISWTGGGGTTDWNTATNWNSGTVPTSADAVTIDANATVTVSSTGLAVSFSSLTIGDVNGTFAAGLVLSTGTNSAGSVLIYQNSGLTIGTSQQILINGNFTMQAGSSMTSTAVTASTNPVDVLINLKLTGTGVFDLVNGATVTLAGLGFAGGTGAGAGPGPGGAGTSNGRGGGGGGHGGAGGSGSPTGAGAGGSANDTSTNPTYPGSSGGAGRTTPSSKQNGGSGGGAFLLNASSASIDGLVAVDGSPGIAASAAGGGGGAGGAINITASYFSGAGTISAKGGGGGTGTGAGGGGGGGNISINVTVSGTSCTLAGFAVAGGTSAATAGTAGVISATYTLAAATLSSVNASSTTVEWDWNLIAGGNSYQVFSSTGGNGQSAVLSAGTTDFIETSLTPNTTYTRDVKVLPLCGSLSATSANFSASTLAAPPIAASKTFDAVNLSSMIVSWSGNGNPVGVTTFTVVLSTDSFYPNSDSGNVSVSTVAQSPVSTATLTGLLPNTTYSLFIDARNFANVSSGYASLGSSPTLANLPVLLSTNFVTVTFTSATLQWAAMPAAPSSSTAEGYELDASSTNFNGTGTVYSSITFSVAQSTLAIGNLDFSNTYYFRLGSYNWTDTPNYESLGPLEMQISASTNALHLGSLNASVVTSTISVSSIVVTNIGNLPLTFAVWAATTTAGSPWILGTSSGVETVLLQGLWNGATQPSSADFSTSITGSTTTSTASNYKGSQTGIAVPAGSTRTLWFQFWRPTNTAAVNLQEGIGVYIAPVYP